MTNCQSCNYGKLETIIDLGSQPLCNRFLNSKKEFRNEKRYPLKLVYCPRCNLVQLSYTLPTHITFDKNFNYLTGTNPGITKYFNDMALNLSKQFRLSRGDYIVDIGSNDGTALIPFKNEGLNVLGIDPAPKPARIANKLGVRTIVKSLEDSVDQINRETKGRIKLITAYNVLAHTHDINEFLDGISKILEKNNRAVFISQSHYFINLIDSCEFDTIYHEHARYYTVTSIKTMFARHGLNLYHAEKSKYYGGSILIYAGVRKPTAEERRNITGFINAEKEYVKPVTYRRFSKEVIKKRDMLRKMLSSMKSNGKRIVGIGAPMKSSTLLNYCKIDTKTLDCLTEVNKLKIGTYSPGMHIKVVSEEEIMRYNPDVALILSWNHAENIMRSLKARGFKGFFIVPLPLPKLIKA